jgi:hypothetical protein
VTLTTDFGSAGPYAGAVKGVILRLCPRAQVVDITHDVPAGDVLSGAYILAQAAPYFPPGTAHVVVVDPGVGTERRILAGVFAGQTYLFPDNGVITLVAAGLPLEELVVVRNPEFLPAPEAPATFHGRDVFAPLAAAMLNGLDLEVLGPQPDTYKLLDLPQPVESSAEIGGQVVWVDSFGNLVTNIPAEMVRHRWHDGAVRVWCAGKAIGELQLAYGFVGPHEPVAVVNSMGAVEIGVNRSRADRALNAGIGTAVRIVGVESQERRLE